MLRISWLFCIFRYSPANKVWKPKRGKFSNKDMAKVQNISEIHPTLGFTEFDIIEKYRKSFHESELGRLHSVFPFERIAPKAGLWSNVWEAGTFLVFVQRSVLWC